MHVPWILKVWAGMSFLYLLKSCLVRFLVYVQDVLRFPWLRNPIQYCYNYICKQSFWKYSAMTSCEVFGKNSFSKDTVYILGWNERNRSGKELYLTFDWHFSTTEKLKVPKYCYQWSDWQTFGTRRTITEIKYDQCQQGIEAVSLKKILQNTLNCGSQ